MQGYTQVWEGSPESLLDSAQPWKSLIGTSALIVVPYGHISTIYIANEFIDWTHYRNTGEYICCWGQNVVNPTR